MFLRQYRRLSCRFNWIDTFSFNCQFWIENFNLNVIRWIENLYSIVIFISTICDFNCINNVSIDIYFSTLITNTFKSQNFAFFIFCFISLTYTIFRSIISLNCIFHIFWINDFTYFELTISHILNQRFHLQFFTTIYYFHFIVTMIAQFIMSTNSKITLFDNIFRIRNQTIANSNVVFDFIEILIFHF